MRLICVYVMYRIVNYIFIYYISRTQVHFLTSHVQQQQQQKNKNKNNNNKSSTYI